MALSLLAKYVRNANIIIENSLRCLLNNNFPPAVCLQLNGAQLGSHNEIRSIPTAREIFQQSILWGVPKKRRSIEVRLTRKHGHQKLLYPKNNIRSCDVCGHFYEAHTICGNCYDKVRAETAEMKEAIIKAQPDGPMDKPVVVLYEGEESEKKFHPGSEFVEIPKVRPAWFSKNLLSQSTLTGNSDASTVKESDEVQVRIKNDSS